MPRAGHPHQFTWCHNPYAEMLLKVRTQGKGQVNVAEMPTLLHPPQPITGGQRKCAEMPQLARPHQFLWCRTRSAEMPTCRRTIGGEPILAHRNVTRRTLSPTNHRGPNISRRNAPMASPPPVYRVPYRLRRNATKGAHQREGSPARRKNAKERTPFPINHRGPSRSRSNAIDMSPPPNLGHTSSAAMSG